jgi:nitrate reductase NapE
VNNQASGRSAPSGAEAAGRKSEWPKFLLLAFVGLPITMTLAIAAYGFVVWLLQILFFGPPS